MCTNCLEGNFLLCCSEKGTLFSGEYGDDDSNDNNSDIEYEEQAEFGDNIDNEELERYEMRSESVLQVLQKGNIIALFSPSNALELFYLCKVIDFGVATKDLRDENNHQIGEGSSYILVNYFEKNPNSEFRKGNIIYKLIPKPVYVHPTQVMSTNVTVTCIGSSMHLAKSEYQWLGDSI